MLPTYTAYVRVYAKPAGGYPKGHIRVEVRVAGTMNDAALAERPEYRRIGTYHGVSKRTAESKAREAIGEKLAAAL